MSKERPYFLKLLISISHCVKCKIMPIIYTDEEAIKKTYRKYFGKEINLEDPKTFAEKLNWQKLYDRDPLMTICADKCEVRSYVENLGYGDTLNEVYGVYYKIRDINIDELPNEFVLKAAHGSHMNIVVTDKKKIKWKQDKLLMWTWLHQDIYWPLREWPYKKLKKRIVAEKYLEDESGELRDYKFFCFHGKPKYLQVDFGRFSGGRKRNYYDMNMNKLDLRDAIENIDLPGKILDDEIFEKMKKMAADLSRPFNQVRVDLYLVNKKIYFGEMTFFHSGGTKKFIQDEWNTKFSEDWKINR